MLRSLEFCSCCIRGIRAGTRSAYDLNAQLAMSLRSWFCVYVCRMIYAQYTEIMLEEEQ